MSHATASVDYHDAVSFAHALEARMWAGLLDKLNSRAQDGQLSFDDVRECIDSTLECAREASDSECVQPDYDVLSASLEDIRHGRCRDIQEVIDELQGAGC